MPSLIASSPPAVLQRTGGDRVTEPENGTGYG
jgi:hypothetical protein